MHHVVFILSTILFRKVKKKSYCFFQIKMRVLINKQMSTVPHLKKRIVVVGATTMRTHRQFTSTWRQSTRSSTKTSTKPHHRQLICMTQFHSVPRWCTRTPSYPRTTHRDLHDAFHITDVILYWPHFFIHSFHIDVFIIMRLRYMCCRLEFHYPFM